MLRKFYYTWENLDSDVQKIIKHIKDNNWEIDAIYAIPRGGLVLGTMLSYILNVPLINVRKGFKNILVVDDLSDSGKTLNSIPNIKLYKTITLHIKEKTTFIPDFYCKQFGQNHWIVYCWEPKDSKTERDGTLQN